MNVTALRRNMILVAEAPKLVMDDGAVFPVPYSVAKPATDLLALRDEPGYLEWLEEHWGNLASKRLVRSWIRKGVREQLDSAVDKTLRRGRFPYSGLAELLERVRLTDSGVIAPSLPVLAAWSLERAVQARISFARCGECGSYWASRGRKSAQHCYRPSPGLATTCAQLHAHERFAGRQEAWDKEYRRIYARKLRGTVTDDEWQAWRTDGLGSASAPDFYVSFDIWRQGRRSAQAAGERAVAQVAELIREAQRLHAAKDDPDA